MNAQILYVPISPACVHACSLCVSQVVHICIIFPIVWSRDTTIKKLGYSWKYGKSNLYEFEGDLEGEGFVIVGVEGTLLDGRLLLA